MRRHAAYLHDVADRIVAARRAEGLGRHDDLLEILPPVGGATWNLPFTKAAVPEVRLADRKVIGVRPQEVV